MIGAILSHVASGPAKPSIRVDRRLPNKALQPTASSVRSCVAPASGSG